MSKGLVDNEMQTSDLDNNEIQPNCIAEILNEIYEKGERYSELLFEKGLTVDDVDVCFECKSDKVGFVFRSKTKKAYDVMTELKENAELI